MNDSSGKMQVAALSIVSNTVLIILKVIAGILSGSISIISEAIHSGVDLIAAIIAFFSVRYSSRPADKEHPYGHGKMENVSGVIEGALIFLAAGLIIVESVKKMIHPTDIDRTTIAIAVMFISGAVNTFVSAKLYKVAKREDSVALAADALHLKTDVYTSVGVGIGMILIKVTGLTILDPIVAVLVAFLVIKEAWGMCIDAFKPLMDTRLSDEDQETIKRVIAKYEVEFVEIHRYRSRKAGHLRFVDFHMTVPNELTVEEAHELCDRIERDLEETVKNLSISIHIEPMSHQEQDPGERVDISSTTRRSPDERASAEI